jgi:hypothetical protein
MVYIQNKICDFILQVLTAPFTLPKNRVSNHFSLFSKTLSFWIVSSHITMIQNQQKFKIQINKIP